MISKTDSHLKITLSLATKLVAQQFPKMAHLEVKPVEPNGIDNRTFHLGKEMLIRLPSAEDYALQVPKEQKWLKTLAPHLSLSIPEPLEMGQPSKHYPWNWSIYRWIEGESINKLSINDLNLQVIAFQLAQFLNELHRIDVRGGPSPGLHNYWRGGHISIYDAEVKLAIMELQGLVDTQAITSVWEKAISSKWNKNPVWIHGDFAIGNILVKDRYITAVIDFGCMGIGDPACDLVIAWNFLKNESRRIFKSHLCLDQDTWTRARGWALWKALITIGLLKDKTSPEVMKQRKIIDEILTSEC